MRRAGAARRFRARRRGCTPRRCRRRRCCNRRRWCRSCWRIPRLPRRRRRSACARNGAAAAESRSAVAVFSAVRQASGAAGAGEAAGAGNHRLSRAGGGAGAVRGQHQRRRGAGGRPARDLGPALLTRARPVAGTGVAAGRVGRALAVGLGVARGHAGALAGVARDVAGLTGRAGGGVATDPVDAAVADQALAGADTGLAEARSAAAPLGDQVADFGCHALAIAVTGRAAERPSTHVGRATDRRVGRHAPWPLQMLGGVNIAPPAGQEGAAHIVSVA